MRSYGRYWHALGEQRAAVTAAFVLSIANLLIALALPWPLKFLIDGVLTGQATTSAFSQWSAQSQVLFIAAVLFSLSASGAYLLAKEKLVFARIRERFGLNLRAQLIHQIYAMPRFERQQEASGELTMRLTSDVQHVSRLFCKTLPLIVKHMATALITLGMVCWIDWRLGLACLLLLAVMVWIVRTYAPTVANAAADKRRLEGGVSALTQEAVQSIEHVQSMALEARSEQRYLQRAAASLKAGVHEVRQAVALERMTQIVAGGALAVVAALGGLLVLRQEMSLGLLTVCLAYVTALLKPVEKLNELTSAVARGIARVKRIDALFASLQITGAAPESRDASPVLGRIRQIDCVDVTFRYPDSVDAGIRHFSHRFRQGELTLLVGPSGSGKSTLLRLLLNLLIPQHGCLKANDLPYQALSSAQLRGQFAVMSQDPQLFSGSIRDLLRELAPNAADADLFHALAQVRLADLVEQLPHGLDSRLDETASQVSGGQRARLLLARTLLGNRPVVVLDEPFANLDADSTRVIAQTLQSVKRDRILIVVSHERALCVNADHIVDLSNTQALPEAAAHG